MVRRIKRAAESVYDDVVNIRRHIHAHPELAFEEYETARFVLSHLEDLPVTVQSGIAETGIVATLHGERPGPTQLLRADMDALPIKEETGLPFSSTTEGVMHACGHDVHTASLLGTAKILSSIQDDVPGTVRFLFQPSEERLPGGAKVMIEEGVLEANDAGPAPHVAFAQHTTPELRVGKIGVCRDTYMASADEIHITIRGEGGHAAGPHELSTDTVLTASQVVVALQSVVSRHCPPDVPSVLSIGRLIADGATNVLPEAVHLEGTFRAMDEHWRFRAHDIIRRVVHHTAEALGATAELEIRVGYPALINHPQPTDRVMVAARNYVGADNVVTLDPWFASEDFAFFLQRIPGCFYRLGTGNKEKGISSGLHTPTFDVDEESLRIGCGFMAYLACSVDV